jgi:hypothetical protein
MPGRVNCVDFSRERVLLELLKPLRRKLFETNLLKERNRASWKLACRKKRRMLLWLLKRLEPLAKKLD